MTALVGEPESTRPPIVTHSPGESGEVGLGGAVGERDGLGERDGPGDSLELVATEAGGLPVVPPPEQDASTIATGSKSRLTAHTG